MELSKCEGTIGKVIKDNFGELNACVSKEGLIEKMEELLASSSNKDKHGFLYNLKECKGYLGAMNYILNYLLKGDGHGII